jgi:hypothetical protein
MLARLGMQDLEQTVEELGKDSRDTHLLLDLTDRDPDEAANKLAYEKGYFLLRLVEETVGRAAFDAFLRDYFDRHAFQSMTTAAFVAELTKAFPNLDVEKWVHGPGIPADVPKVQSAAFERVEEQVRAFEQGAPMETAKWSTHEWIHFLRHLPHPLTGQQMSKLDTQFKFTESGNSEILHEWLLQAIENRYEPAYGALERFLLRQGRRKFLKPLYEKLAKNDLDRARAIYAKARPTYHAVSRGTIDGLLKWS